MQLPLVEMCRLLEFDKLLLGELGLTVMEEEVYELRRSRDNAGGGTGVVAMLLGCGGRQLTDYPCSMSGEDSVGIESRGDGDQE